MKKYYFSNDEEQFGPYSIDELKKEKITTTTLIWFEGLPSWILAKDIKELQELFKNSPPPLPSKNKIKNQVDSYNYKRKEKKRRKYDLSYKKEFDATVIGFIFFIIHMYIYGSGFLENVTNNSSWMMIYSIIQILYRIIVTIWVIAIAKRLNRTTEWGFLAFFIPPLALIIIGLLRKLNREDVNDVTEYN